MRSRLYMWAAVAVAMVACGTEATGPAASTEGEHPALAQDVAAQVALLDDLIGGLEETVGHAVGEDATNVRLEELREVRSQLVRQLEGKREQGGLGPVY